MRPNSENPIRGEIFSVERLEEYANFLAGQLVLSEDPRVSQPLLPRMHENGRRLLAAYRALAFAIHKKETISPAAEWLTDNFHIVENQLREIEEDLPPTFYRELPKIAQGELAGYPRIYAIALAVVAHTDSQLEPESIRRFVQAYQKISPLRIGELWALAITLRLVLVENLCRIIVRAVEDHEKVNLANKYADALFEVTGDKKKFRAHTLSLLSPCRPSVKEDCSYTAQIAKRLRDQEPELWPALEHLEKLLASEGSSTGQVVHQCHQLQAANHVTVANVITSMRLLSSVNWQEFFESLSGVDRILEKDPVYGRMDFATRDRYRHVIEKIGKATRINEAQIAEKVISLTGNAHGQRAHVGYFLIGSGISELEKHFKCRTTGRVQRFFTARPNLTYFGLLTFFFSLAVAWPFYHTGFYTGSFLEFLLVGLLIVFPCSELAYSLTNLVLSHTLHPRILPKMDLENGIPRAARTMVVVPCLLSDGEVITELLERLEIHYLGNSNEGIYFSLLTDFHDAQTEIHEEDAAKLQLAVDGIAGLNRKYATEKFFLFHRRRSWNPVEQCWMGWERKRGKIHEFNRLLRGDQHTHFTLSTASKNLLTGIKYIITLDADTQLPRGSAARMIGTVIHPLNLPHFDVKLGRVTAGYGILQPRIGISLESANRSLFANIFSGRTGIDPYTTAVSDVYQDLFAEGNYTGKGLYDVDTFMAALENRVPENAILSHDLFEGIHTRVGLLGDLELIDDYPQTYRTFFLRQHRWTRGDWQIAPWLFNTVRNAKNQKIRNPLSLIARWKILDNLRRSLVAPFMFFWFIAAWTVLPGAEEFWLGYGLFVFLVPGLAPALTGSFIAHLNNPASHFLVEVVKFKDWVLQSVLSFILLPHQACVQLDAIARVFYRKLFSGRKLLEWTTSGHVDKHKTSKLPLMQTFSASEFLLTVLLVLVIVRLPKLPPAASAFLLLLFLAWVIHPGVAQWVSRRTKKKRTTLAPADRFFLRGIARRTWHYFEAFVGPGDNWLPPDNHQLAPEPATAHRTSPTNIGLYVLSLVSARDLGFVSSTKFIMRLGSTLKTLQKMELYNGHFLNWYDTATLQGLYPKYISTVDSGNLAGYLLAASQACLEVKKSPVADLKLKEGFADTMRLVEEELAKTATASPFAEVFQLLGETPAAGFAGWYTYLTNLLTATESSQVQLLQISTKHPEKNLQSATAWATAALAQLKEARDEIEFYVPWVTTEFDWFASAELNRPLSWEDLPALYRQAEARLRAMKKNRELFSLIAQAERRVQQLLAEATHAAQVMNTAFENMDFCFLLDKKRGIFSIGYNVSEQKFDSGLYDLLGSESRLASFVAIAKGDLPQEHWFRLGRQLVPIAGGRALISWTASMFEYLMPVLVMRNYENTLLEETTRSVVARQIAFGKKQRVPWGISEAGYNARDLQMNYQYGPFGIPGLGLKRGLSQDLVVSPYSTLLALMIQPVAAIKNMKRLIRKGLLTDFGFFEAVDYTTERLQENKKFAVIRSFMAHHQGMSLIAINNVLNGNIIQDRFHSDPRVQATRLLLQERIPHAVKLAPPKAAEIEYEAPVAATAERFVRTYLNADSPTPHIQLLSNQSYSVMLSAAGGGYSKCKGLAVTRWKEDGTRDNWGSYIFIRNPEDKSYWSTGLHPSTAKPETYKVTFGEEKVEFSRRDGMISTLTQIIVAPEDDVEIRHVTLINHSDTARILELTSYLEPVLTVAAGDLDHPAFSKLFLQTEFLASKNALLCKRRKRSKDDTEVWGLHSVVTDAPILTGVEYETDRARFIGRGGNLSNAHALNSDEPLSNTSGATLDPILALRIKVVVPANGKTRVAFTTGLTFSREEALSVTDRYHEIHSFEREASIAWTKSQADLRHLNINSETAYLFQRLAERILFSDASLKSPAHQRAAGTSMQSSLWPSGISGDLPIMLIRITDKKSVAFVRVLLRCHEYLRLKGLSYDFVIVNDDESKYLQELQDELQQQIRSTGSQQWLNKPGGLFILRRDSLREKDLAHIRSVARVLLTPDEPLKDQVKRKPLQLNYPELLHIKNEPHREFVRFDAKPELEFFNGFGGFDHGGQEYHIRLTSGSWTPAPWINVIGNHRGFGFQVSETGSGFTWSTNSQTNRLTPWSNDPVSDPPGEIIYLRDEDTGELWTPTPLPIRENTDYLIRHGQGYTVFEHSAHGIQHQLTIFVPKDDNIKISLLKLRNISKRKRRLSITGYTEWVLGSRREKTAPYLICEVDHPNSAIYARNPNDNEFADRVAFMDMNISSRTFTCSRKEFLGRNGNYMMPAALQRIDLSNRKETGQDPCAALQTKIEVAPGEEFEMSFSVGQCENRDLARELSLHYRNHENVKRALNQAAQYWDDLNQTLQVRTPEASLDLLVNNWLVYQSLSCRYFSRTAHYQSGGAYGFRDQLQDCMAFVYGAPNLAREHIVRSAGRQFKEGDVQHWWHPPFGRGIRTRMSDDLLWLPFVVSFYVNTTGDKSILAEHTPFLEAELLKPEEEDSYTLPKESAETASVFEHCLRAIEHSLTLGKNGLPLIGTGDWNDGMNRVGAHGIGESVWLGWFLHKVISDFLPFIEEQPIIDRYNEHLKKLKHSLEKNGWDGDWYRRAYFDDGTPIGSKASSEAKIDSISQSWAVLSNAGDPARARRAMEKVNELLVRKDAKLILLLTPPFDQITNDPGYIKGYVPGVRENGGQYTHAAIWVVMAFAQLGDGNKAMELFNMLNPILHAAQKSDAEKYKVEPYVVTADIYAADHEGRGGWSWYTGSASWYYRAALESILGFRLQGNRLKLVPCIPTAWQSYEISFRFGKAIYEISIRNPNGVSSGKMGYELDGVLLKTTDVELVDDAKNHKIVATLQLQREAELSPL